MGRRPILKFRPDLERFEEKQLLSGGASAAHATVAHSAATAASAGEVATPDAVPANTKGFLAYRITNPTGHFYRVGLYPPFLQTHVQTLQPVPGQVYNIIYVAIKNGTSHTFTAQNGFTARVPGFTGNGHVAYKGVPMLTGNQVWKPHQWLVLYIFTKKYYPFSPQVAAGFQIQTDGRSSTIVPGPSGFIAHIKYNPATISKVINFNVAYGQGAQLGPGAAQGIGDTAINILVSAKSNRMDYAGHF